ncbi:acetate--CoA ligase family protein [Rhodosalinus sp. FB01]|uniref:acetate--CoA ligase family protein n=1 Tax=Rhodosalinus sp. FB01 TaxID=3239194 RepID=UPI0035255BD7
MTAAAGPRDLSRLLRPRSVAVIGGGWGRAVVAALDAMGFPGEVWPIHPTAPEISGRRTFVRLEDLPGPPDAAYVAINRGATVAAVRGLSEIGAGGAVCFASGFAEAEAESTGSGGLQQALVDAAGTMPIIGPNCYGFVNYLDGALLWPDQHGGVRVPTGVAIVTQSSNIAINLTMQARALPLAYAVTAGNQAQTGLAEIAHALAADPRVTALGLHVEGVRDIAAWEALAARIRARGLPVVVLKAGRSTEARAATLSHTGSFAGDAAGARAFFARLGFAEVETLPGFLEALKLGHMTGGLARGGLAALSSSGGEASLAADAGLARGLAFPALTDPQRARLRAALGPMVALANPLDYHTYVWGDAGRMADTFAAMDGPHLAAMAVIADFPRADRCETAGWDCVVEAALAARARVARPLIVVSTLPEGMPEPVAARLMAGGVVPMAGLEPAFEALAAFARVAGASVAPAPLLHPCAGRAAPRLLSEAKAKAALAAHGVPVPRGETVEGPAAAGLAAGRLGGPVAVKALGIAHKSESGAVALGLSTPEAARRAAAGMPGARFLVEEMVEDGVAELLLGVTRDPAHGFVLTLAAGGVLTELLADSASLLVPSGEDEIAAALDGLRAAPLLAGYRGRPSACRASILAAAMALQRFVAAEAHRLVEVEINPLICAPTRAVAADALVRFG